MRATKSLVCILLVITFLAAMLLGYGEDGRTQAGDYLRTIFFCDIPGNTIFLLLCLFCLLILLFILLHRKRFERKRLENLVKQRTINLETLCEMSILFLSHTEESFEEKMTMGVKLIVDKMDLDRVSIWRNFMKPDGLHTSQIYRWDGESGGTTRPMAGLEDIQLSQITSNWDKISSGEIVINGPVRLIGDPHLALTLERFGVNSALVVPLSIDNKNWGFVLFADLRNERIFDESAVEVMQSAALLCANTVIHQEMARSTEAALKHATAASKAKGDFLASMSHEIRTPVNAIIGMIHIGKSSDDPERKDYCLNKIEDASKHLLGVINDVLDMSKIEAGKFELSLTEFNFEEMLQRVVNVVKFRADEKEQTLAVHIDKSIPDYLIGDDQRLAQIITNLVGNAVKFTPEKGSIDIRAQFLKEENNVCTIQISVIDTGIGISPEQQAKLFHSFQQAENSTARNFGGTGLGLAISKSIVEMIGGKIWAESELSKGSTFSFAVQLKRGAGIVSENLGRKAEDDRQVISDRFEGRCILLVEDIEINREIVLSLLEPTLLEIDCAVNGNEAVRMFSESPEKYDMIFMDVQMPEMNGYEATRAIRALDIQKAKDIPIIAMTADVFREDVEKCIASGMNDHVGKPLDFDDVISQLRRYLKYPIAERRREDRRHTTDRRKVPDRRAGERRKML